MRAGMEEKILSARAEAIGKPESQKDAQKHKFRSEAK